MPAPLLGGNLPLGPGDPRRGKLYPGFGLQRFRPAPPGALHRALARSEDRHPFPDGVSDPAQAGVAAPELAGGFSAAGGGGEAESGRQSFGPLLWDRLLERSIPSFRTNLMGKGEGVASMASGSSALSSDLRSLTLAAKERRRGGQGSHYLPGRHLRILRNRLQRAFDLFFPDALRVCLSLDRASDCGFHDGVGSGKLDDGPVPGKDPEIFPYHGWGGNPDGSVRHDGNHSPDLSLLPRLGTKTSFGDEKR